MMHSVSLVDEDDFLVSLQVLRIRGVERAQ